MRRKRLSLTALIFLILAFSQVKADWINLTGAETAPNIAEISVFDDRVEAALEIYVGDLDVSKGLIPVDRLQDMWVDQPMHCI